ncbi:hypothetical protein ASU31_16130 [Pedobacter ginsenosidimutans]|uniref:Uncharacterized protein n=1 Tax=Pedobacter ginsenosidimutans TaxID=687842 RepID=A0A0T5VMQ2_9SPHI|nr:hypothetical protein ASU31_16130 [Pedobacter ginsenosidimutans]
MTGCFISPSRTGLFLFDVKKKQKTPAENFSFEASRLACAVQPEKFIRPDLSRTGIRCYGLVGWKYKIAINNSYLDDYKTTSMIAESKDLF